MSLTEKFHASMKAFPCVAILRGLEPADALEMGQAFFDNGFRMIEVPLNSPEPYKSIEILAKAFGEEAIIGAGTVLTTTAVTDVQNAGGEIIVSPNMNVSVIEATKAKGMLSAPGVQTPTEAFGAIHAGADAIKFFPGESITPAIFKAMKAVLPPDVPTLIVGGIRPELMENYLKSGASGFGIGSGVFKAGDSLKTVQDKAVAFKSELIRQKVI